MLNQIDPVILVQRAAEIGALVPQVLSLYSDIRKDGDLDSPKALVAIVDFARDKSELLEQYVAPNEVLMFVCAILGFLHEGDSSELYLKLIEVEETQQ